MWVVEELRGSVWARVSHTLEEAEAQLAVRRLRSDRPWRAYRLTRA